MTDTKTEDRVAKLRAEADQLSEIIKEKNREISELNSSLKQIETEIIDLTVPWKVGDVVRDEKGVEYRVTHVRMGRGPSGLAGIRLHKNGSEAYKDPRTIWAKELELVRDQPGG